MRKGWLPSKTSLLAVVLPLCGVIGLLSPASAGATNITAFPVDFSVAEGAAFNGAVATFEDDNAAATPSDFTSTLASRSSSAPSASAASSHGITQQPASLPDSTRTIAPASRSWSKACRQKPSSMMSDSQVSRS